MKLKALLLAATTAVALSLAAVPATAATVVPDGELQAKIDAVMAKFPGGVQIADDSVAWQKGEIVLTLEGGSNARSVATCTTGSYCGWSGASYTGTKLSFTACSAAGTSSSLALLTATRSLANARTSGMVRAKNLSTTVYTLPASTGIASNPATLTSLVCYT